MKSLNPTYLYKSRHGIFYLRVRIPLSVKKQYNTAKNEIKRSLNTRNYSVALKAARRLWVELEKTDYTMNDLDIEIETFEQNAYEGRQLLKRFLIASIQSDETGILDEETDSFFTDLRSTSDSETHILFMQLNRKQKDLLYKELQVWCEMEHEKKKLILLKLKSELPTNTPIASPPPTSTISTPTISSEIPENKPPTLLDAIDEYMLHYIDIRSRGTNPKPIPPNTISEYRGILKEFVRIINGEQLNSNELNKSIITDYDKKIWKVPVSFIKKNAYKGKSVKSVIALGHKTKANSTIEKHIGFIKNFLKWAEHEDYTVAGLCNSFTKIYSEDKPDHEKRPAFTPKELTKLFNNEIYERGRFKNNARYWLPLIALFTGMRGREIAQLYCDDIQRDTQTEIWFIEIRANMERMQWKKNPSAPRKIPVHPMLKRLGFIDFVQSSKKNTMLFPELYNESGNPYKNWGNSFNRKANSGWKWQCGVKGETVFHSFRHNVIDFLEKANVHKRPACFLVGHKYEGGFVSNYIKSDDLQELYKTIKVLSYPSINWKKIEKRRW